MVVTVRVTAFETPGVRVTVELLRETTGGRMPLVGEIAWERGTLPEKPELDNVIVADDLPPATKLDGEAVEAETWKTPETVIETVTLWVIPGDPLIVTIRV